MSLSNSLGKNSWIFGVKEKVNSCDFSLLGGIIIRSFVDIPFCVVFIDQNSPPVPDTVLISPEALAWDGLELVLVNVAALNPFQRCPSVVFRVIERLQRQLRAGYLRA